VGDSPQDTHGWSWSGWRLPIMFLLMVGAPSSEFPAEATPSSTATRQRPPLEAITEYGTGSDIIVKLVAGVSLRDVIGPALFRGLEETADFEDAVKRMGPRRRIVSRREEGRYVEQDTGAGLLRVGFFRDGSAVGVIYRWRVRVVPRGASIAAVFHADIAKHLEDSKRRGRDMTVTIFEKSGNWAIGGLLSRGEVVQLDCIELNRHGLEWAQLPPVQE
jgi:hypothetical protein